MKKLSPLDRALVALAVILVAALFAGLGMMTRANVHVCRAYFASLPLSDCLWSDKVKVVAQ